MEYSKKQRKEYIDNRGISVAKSKFVRFLVVGIIVLVLLSSGEVLAQGTSEPTWKLVETRINPGNEPTELIVGVTPNYLNKMWTGTFNKYTVEETYFIHKRHVVKYGSVQADCEMRADFTKPPEILVPGETINLTANVSGTGTSPGIGSNIRFTYRNEGFNLRGETSVSTGSGDKPPFSTRSISPYFVVPETHSGEISIHAFLWNVDAANVIWVYRAQDSTPSEENCEGYCKTIQGANMDRAIWDGVSDYPNCGCICEKGWEMTVDGCVACEDICGEKDRYVYDPDESDDNVCECKCEVGYEYDYSSEKCKKVECLENSTNIADIDGLCPQDRKLNPHCCCDEGYIQYGESCMKKEPGTAVYSIIPAVSAITVGEEIGFTLIKKEYGRYTTISNDKTEWSVVKHKSINPGTEHANTVIGTIDTNGVFTSKNIGTCVVNARIDGTDVKADVPVKCRQDAEGDINEILRLYRNRIPKGRLWHDAHQLDNILSNPPAAGCYNNILSAAGYKVYDQYVCEEYQTKVMNFLYDIQSNPEECSLLNGLEFSRITGCGGMHLAVVIYKSGTSWEETGTVLDPWPSQKPQVYPIDQWIFYGRTTGRSMVESGLSAGSALIGDIVKNVKIIAGMVRCPVNILITDNDGRRLGVLDDGSMVFEIPNAIIMNIPDDNGENNWYFELNSSLSNTYNLEIIGTDEGTFELLIANKKDKSIKYYGKQPIAQGEKAEIVLDSSNPEASLILQDGTEVQPTSIQPTSIEKSKSDNYNHILAQPAVQKVIIGQNLQFDGFTGTVAVSRLVSGDIENVYQADANNRIYNVNWPTSGAYYVNYDAATKLGAARISVEKPDVPLELKVGTKRVSSIAAGTDLKVYTGGINLFDNDLVDLIIIGPDGQIKEDTKNNQKFTGITVAALKDFGNKLITNGWKIGDYTFQVKSKAANACGLELSSDVRPLKILKGEISIDAEPTSTMELDTVTVTITGVAGDEIRVVADPCDGAKFIDGVEDTPTNAGCEFTNTIDADGIRTYVIEFNDTGDYTIMVTVQSGPRAGDYDTVDITASEKGVMFDLPSAIVIGEKLDIKGIANTGTYVDVFVNDALYAKLYDLPLEADGTFSKEVITTDVGMTVPGLVTLKAWLDCAKRRGESPPTRSADGSAAILVLKTHLDATISNTTVAPGDIFEVFGNASSDYVEIVLISPDGGNGTGMDGLYGTTIYTVPTFCNSTNYFNNYYKKLKVDSDADNGNYTIIVLNPGRDTAYGDSEYTYIDNILDRDGDGPEPGVMNVSNKTQDEIAAIISDIIYATGSDDFIVLGNIEVA